MTKTITVRTNVADANAQITLRIKGEVWQLVQVTPQNAAFGRIASSESLDSLTRKLKIVNNTPEKLNLEGLAIDNPSFKAELQQVEEGKEYELVVALVPPLQSGNNSGKITMTTGISEMPTLQISAYAIVSAAIDITPTELGLPLDREMDMKRQLYVRSNTGKPFNISGLKTSNPDLKASWQDLKEAMTYRITVDIPKDYKVSPNGDTISFNTDNADVPSITVPVKESPISQPPMARSTYRRAPNPNAKAALQLSPEKAKERITRREASPAVSGRVRSTAATREGENMGLSPKSRVVKEPKSTPAEN